MPSPVLQVEHLRIEFPSRRDPLVAIDDLSFEIAEGEILGLVGESGAGKSLTGAGIIGLLPPPARITGGRILFAGRRIDDLPPEKLRAVRGKGIGAIFQDPLTSLNPVFTVGGQLVETILTHTDLTPLRARERAIELLAEVGIPSPERRFDQYPHEFSGGMRQRVVIALAICANPRLVIADEPTTALDVSVQAQILNLLTRLCAQHGMAILLVTHDMGVIAETTDRVAVLYAGRLAEIGPTRQVIQAPRHPYTAGLMASIPVIGERVAELVQIDGAMPRLGEIPAGCAFHPRCRRAFDPCASRRPELSPVGGARVACWLYPEGGAA